MFRNLSETNKGEERGQKCSPQEQVYDGELLGNNFDEGRWDEWETGMSLWPGGAGGQVEGIAKSP
jgi:hypothetical protein